MSQGRDESGRYTPTGTESDILRALREHPEPVATAQDLADKLDVTSETVRRHLSSLRDRGVVARKQAGARAVVWWVAETGDGEEIAPAEPLTAITGMLDEEAADEARQRSEEWREEFDDELSPGNEA